MNGGMPSNPPPNGPPPTDSTANPPPNGGHMGKGTPPPQGSQGAVTFPGQGGQPEMGKPNQYPNTIGSWDNSAVGTSNQPAKNGKAKGA